MDVDTPANDKKYLLRHQLARRLRLLRVACNWSQNDLAEASGLHRTYISLIERERCNISLDNVERLACAFGVPATELLIGWSPVKSAQFALGACSAEL